MVVAGTTISPAIFRLLTLDVCYVLSYLLVVEKDTFSSVTRLIHETPEPLD
jgi:hypothetical protein